MIYKNLNYKKMKGSHILIVSCGYCKTDIVKYQKVGRGNLLRLHIGRVIKGSIDFTKNLNCPNCGMELGQKITIDSANEAAYRMIRSAFNTRELDGV